MSIRALFGPTILATALASSLIVTARAQSDRHSFALVNMTGFPLGQLYAAPNPAERWEMDILGHNILENGREFYVSISPDTSACRWDLKAVYDDDGSSTIWRDIDLCRVSRLTLRYDSKAGKTSATVE